MTIKTTVSGAFLLARSGCGPLGPARAMNSCGGRKLNGTLADTKFTNDFKVYLDKVNPGFVDRLEFELEFREMEAAEAAEAKKQGGGKKAFYYCPLVVKYLNVVFPTKDMRNGLRKICEEKTTEDTRGRELLFNAEKEVFQFLEKKHDSFCTG